MSSRVESILSTVEVLLKSAAFDAETAGQRAQARKIRLTLAVLEAAMQGPVDDDDATAPYTRVRVRPGEGKRDSGKTYVGLGPKKEIR